MRNLLLCLLGLVLVTFSAVGAEDPGNCTYKSEGVMIIKCVVATNKCNAGFYPKIDGMCGMNTTKCICTPDGTK